VSPRHNTQRNLSVIPGVSSNILEAIVEISGDIQRFSELKEVIAEHAKECLGLLEAIEKEGINNPQVAIDVLLIDEAIRNLNIRRTLYVRLLQGTAIVLLPLPPHLSSSLLRIAPTQRVFNTERDPPPHLKYMSHVNIDFISLPQLQTMTEGVDSVVLEAYVEHDRIYVRDNASSLIYLLSGRGLKDIFIHGIPHIPPRTRFIELQTESSGINIIAL
jgi:hypothetical protein